MSCGEEQVYEDKNFVIDFGTKKEKLTFTGAYISDGPGFDIIIGALPLEKDYTIIFEMPNLQALKVKQVQLKVLGEHEINKRMCKVVELTSTQDKKDKILLSINDEGFAERIEQNILLIRGQKVMLNCEVLSVVCR